MLERFVRLDDARARDDGGGTVLETEAGDDGAAYGVEVRLPDGRQPLGGARVEVSLPRLADPGETDGR